MILGVLVDLPARLQRILCRHFTLRGLMTHPSKQQADDFLSHIRLLTKQEMVSLFPDGTLYEERVGPFTKSFVVYRPETHRPDSVSASQGAAVDSWRPANRP